MRRTVCASRRKIAPAITGERAIKKARLYKPSVILARAKAPSGSARTELAQVIFFYTLLIFIDERLVLLTVCTLYNLQLYNIYLLIQLIIYAKREINAIILYK